MFIGVGLVLYILFRIVVEVLYNEEKRELYRIKPGLKLLDERNFEEALLYFDFYIQKHPKHAIAYAYRGKCHLGMENYYAALSDSTKANSFERQIPEAFLDKGIAFYKLSLYQESLIELDKAVRLLKNNATSFRWRGMAKSKLNQFDKAQSDFLKAVELGDEHAGYYLIHKGTIEI
jgi:tetratricopeptide (TPR) repeat protein